MTNIVSFLKDVDEHSLVLFDKLGREPIRQKARHWRPLFFLILHRKRHSHNGHNTHYSELKVYALSTAGVENACANLTLIHFARPIGYYSAFRERAHAFAISGRLGLPDYIIDDARKRQLTEQDESLEDLLSDKSGREPPHNRKRESKKITYLQIAKLDRLKIPHGDEANRNV